jgi:hypothetical protein
VNSCPHTTVSCLNPYEFIRKYRCEACKGVMMCACDEEFARRFLPHQLRQGTVLETQERIPVTLGFQPRICNRCRGLPEQAYPKAPRHRATSKLARYYWREIWFEKTRRFADWSEKHGLSDKDARRQHPDVYATIERQVLQEMRELHQRSPRFQFQEVSQSEVLSRHNVAVLNLDGIYVKHAERKAMLLHAGKLWSAEAFATDHLEQQGYTVLRTESIPFHALFGVFLWLLIQDPFDPRVRIVGFGKRDPANGEQRDVIYTHLPEDFGTVGYSKRRRDAIEEHFGTLLRGDTRVLLDTFNYWTHHSAAFRQYLWAHRPEDIARARQIIPVLGADNVRMVLRYLLADYWHHFCGWPDLFAHRPGEFLFAEVKSSGDELSEDQKRWIRDNAEGLRFPFTLIKIHRKQKLNEAEAQKLSSIPVVR